MGDLVRVDQAGFAGSALSFGVLANDVTILEAQLGRALAAEGQCWGSDEVGAEFAGDYLPMLDAAIAKIKFLERSTARISVNITNAAAGYSATDSATASGLAGH